MPVEDIAKKVHIPVLSLPNKPTSFGLEYDFPESVEELPSITLGGWLLKLSAWRGYILRILSKSEMEETILQEYLATKIAKEISKDSEKRVTKDAALGRVIGVEDGAVTRADLIAKQAQVINLKRVLEIYTTQFEAISREISRRGIEAKLISQGV